MSETSTTGVGSGNCQWCGLIHGAKCPLVKAIEYEHGMVKRVEFFAPNDYAPKLSSDPWPRPPFDWTCSPRSCFGGAVQNDGTVYLVNGATVFRRDS